MGLIKQPQIDKIYGFAKELAKFPIFIDLNYTGSIEQTESVIRKYKETHNINIVFIDYIQLLSERSTDQTQELGRISRKLKLLANSMEICIVVLSQLNREVEHRDNKRPLMSDLRQCGNLEEDADFVIGLYRDEYYNPETKDKNKLEFIVLKDRNGPVGTTQIGFDKVTTKVTQ
jgi:replicative DNA helicase